MACPICGKEDCRDWLKAAKPVVVPKKKGTR